MWDALLDRVADFVECVALYSAEDLGLDVLLIPRAHFAGDLGEALIGRPQRYAGHQGRSQQMRIDPSDSPAVELV